MQFQVQFQQTHFKYSFNKHISGNFWEIGRANEVEQNEGCFLLLEGESNQGEML